MITFSKICRLCINNTHSNYTVQFVDEDSVTLGDKMKTACDIQINTYDCLPTALCELCVEKLRQFYDFKLQCLHSNRRLVRFKKRLISSMSKDENPQNVPILSKKEPINKLVNKIKTTNINSIKNNLVQQANVLDIPPLVRINTKPTSNYLLETKNNSHFSETAIDVLKNIDVDSINSDDNSIAYDDFHETNTQVSVTDNVMKQNKMKDPLLNTDIQVNSCKDSTKSEEKVANISLEMYVENAEDELINLANEQERTIVEPVKNHNKGTFEEDISQTSFETNQNTSLEQIEDNVNTSQENTADNDDAVGNDSAVACQETLFDDQKDELYFCQACDKHYINKSSYKCHQRYHTEHTANYQCDRCGKKFKLRSTFEKHMLRYSGERPYKCDVCAKTFTDKVYLYCHSKTHSDVRPYQCEVCGKTFKFASCRRTHMSLHSTERPFECNTCGKTFAQKATLTIHMRTHTGARPFKCTVCEKKFANNYALKTHGITHSKEKQFQCDICAMFFKRAAILREHKKIHSRDPNAIKECKFTCELCGKMLRTKDSLINHAAVHSNERPFKCERCNKSFKYKTCWRAHVRTFHEGKKVVCQVCNKTFLTKNVLSRHKVLHTGEKPHKCDLCGKCFADISSLRDHKLSHTNIRPYKCEFCEKEFKKKYNRFLHMRRKHGNLVKQTEKDTDLIVETDEQTRNDNTTLGTEEKTCEIMMAEVTTETMQVENEELAPENMLAKIAEETIDSLMAENEDETSKILIVLDEEDPSDQITTEMEKQEREKMIFENVQSDIEVKTLAIPALHYYK